MVDRCTLRHHLMCVHITGVEVYKDGKAGRPTRHWWRMSYIGKACVKEYGKVVGHIYEGLFAIPHYSAMALANGLGMLVYALQSFRKTL